MSMEEAIKREIGETAGYVSLCWEPKPTGIFDSEAAARAVEESVARLYADHVAEHVLTADSPEPPIGSVIRMVGGWQAPDAAAVAQHWSDEGWYVAGSTHLYDWPHLFVGWDTVTLLHDGTP